tara:strand:- start:402 stop:764 length:363 start_codon:yes stop_codon:yes gene_type:complete
MREVTFTNRQEQTDSLVLECELAHDGFGLLIALADDKFAEDFSDWNFEQQDTYVAEIDSQVYNCFEFEEYDDIKNLEDLTGKSICIHDGLPIYPDEEIVAVTGVYKVKDYFPHDELQEEE